MFESKNQELLNIIKGFKETGDYQKMVASTQSLDKTVPKEYAAIHEALIDFTNNGNLSSSQQTELF